MKNARYRQPLLSCAGQGAHTVVHVSRVDLNLFAVLDAIYTEGGITRASERLNLTQPAISHVLARWLRDQIRAGLIDRDEDVEKEVS